MQGQFARSSAPTALRGLTSIQGWFPGLAGQDTAPSRTVSCPVALCRIPRSLPLRGQRRILTGFPIIPAAVQAARAPWTPTVAQPNGTGKTGNGMKLPTATSPAPARATGQKAAASMKIRRIFVKVSHAQDSVPRQGNARSDQPQNRVIRQAPARARPITSPSQIPTPP